MSAETLVCVDGPGKKATFSNTNANGSKQLIVKEFDMLHGVPPQKAPEFIRVRPLVVERGNIVHAKFLYGDKVAPNFPK